MTKIKFRYDTPSAFRKALKDCFGQIARADRRYSLDELQRQFAYDRVLARLFSSNDADRWVLKGAGALLARLTMARHSKDVDVFFDAADADVDHAVDALRAAILRRCRRRPREPACTSTRGSARPGSRPFTSMSWWAPL